MKIDLHCHTFYSKDGTASLESIAKEAKKKGVDGVAITDHENTNAWKEAIFWGEKYGVNIILGEEIKSSEGDILGLFMTKNIDGKGKDPRWIMEQIHDQGGLAFIPHPFHELEGFMKTIENYVDLIDGIEVFNGRRPFSAGDKKANDFADKHGLIKIGGSDSHYYKTVGNAFTHCKAKNLLEYREQLVLRNTIVRGKKASLKYIIYPILKKIGLIKKAI